MSASNRLMAAAVHPACMYFCMEPPGEIRLYDVSHPAVPVLKKALVSPSTGMPSHATDLILDGTHLYVLQSGMFSIQSQGHPLSVVATQPPRHAITALPSPVDFSSFGQLEIYDVSDPANPVMVSKTAVAAAGRLFKDGKHLYVGFSDRGGNSRGFGSYDVTDPARPTLLKSYGSGSSEGYEVGLAVAGKALYLLTPGKDVQVFDLDAATPRGTALDVGGTPQGLAQRNGRLYVARASAEQPTPGVAVFDIGTPLRPRRLTDLFADRLVRDLQLFDGFGVLTLPEVLPAGGSTMTQPERFSLFATR